jgi:hypothetical protein
VSHRRDLPLAATPLLFSIQQATEGMLWLTLPNTTVGATPAILTIAYLVFAHALWPVLAPMAVLLVEPDRSRRGPMWACLALGLGVACYLSWRLIIGAPTAQLMHDHIVYSTGQADHPLVVGLVYLAATGVPLLLSSSRTITILGIIVLIGSGVAYMFFWRAFQSVWCFFAAAGSFVILGHFYAVRRANRDPVAYAS